MQKSWWSRVRIICRDGDGSGAGAGDGTGTGAGDDTGTGTGAGDGVIKKTFTQDDVNKMLAAEKRTWQDKVQTSVAALENIKREGLTPEQKAELQSQIDSLRAQAQTAEEIAKQKLSKAERDWAKRERELVEQRDAAVKAYSDLEIQTELSTAMALHRVKPAATSVVSSYLKANLSQAPVLDSEGKPTGRKQYMVAMTAYDAESKTTKALSLPVVDAVNQLREREEFANLFESAAKAGMGQGASGRTGTNDIAKMSQEEYMAARAANPRSLGLTRK
jgi:hypothetical protein